MLCEYSKLSPWAPMVAVLHFRPQDRLKKRVTVVQGGELHPSMILAAARDPENGVGFRSSAPTIWLWGDWPCRYSEEGMVLPAES